MKRNKKRVFAALAVIAALAAGGAAYTNSIDTGSTTGADAGYGSIAVAGNNTLSSVSYGFTTDGSQIHTVNLTFGTAVPATQDVQVAFTAGGARQDCGDGTGSTTFTCTLTTDVDTSSVTQLGVLITDAS